MLKALELHGFKSFADKTRFEFPPGITVIVGPNGSGKSNIVDCVKWVLGEQSVKSLRGKDMADVIFKGAGSSGRKAMNTAEATLVFDNSDKRLPIDAPEVHITRRIYRSGEGEYLINRQPARLKDIRDLFRGTGVGVDAYSLIEQGKVDRLLQASAKDRRAIFEEAAGISRFKAKKVEAQRRLERVEQNLLRLSDIVEEVENRLKTVRAQAAKAKRYREYSERLQQLRTQIALVDWRRLSAQLEQHESESMAAQDRTQAADAQSQRLEAQQLELDTAVLAAGEELRNCEHRLAFVRQHLAAQQATIEHETSRTAELEDQTAHHGRDLLALSDKAVDVRSRLKASEAELTAASRAEHDAAAELSLRESQLASLIAEQEAARRQAEDFRREHLIQIQTVATLTSQVEALQVQRASVRQAALHHQQQLAELTTSESTIGGELSAAERQQAALHEQLAVHREQTESIQSELVECRNLHASRADDLALLHGRQHGVAQKAEMLEEFERTLEGLGGGVKQVLARAGVRGQERGDRGQRMEDGADHPWSLVRGVVADFLEAKVENATAIDVALSDMAHAIVVEGSMEDVRALIAAADDLAGRVCAISSTGEVFSTQYSTPGTTAIGIALPTIELTSEMVVGVGIIARADKLVECPDEYVPLATLLLGRTFVVRTLEDALRLRAKAPPGTRVVTQANSLTSTARLLLARGRQPRASSRAAVSSARPGWSWQCSTSKLSMLSVRRPTSSAKSNATSWHCANAWRAAGRWSAKLLPPRPPPKL
jgi:chromosome segregation protein